MARDKSSKREILAAIRRAGEELGRAPSRGELRRITGVSHYRVLKEFRTLREAVRAAGLEPNPKGERIATGELIRDWKRVKKKLGKRPSRAEYVREGKYSAGAFVGRFGSWGRIGTKPFTTEDTEKHRGELAKLPKVPKNPKLKSGDRKGREGAQREIESGDKAIAFRWGQQLAQIPGPLAGKRRVTEVVAQLVVNTLLGESTQQSALGIQPNQNQNRELNHKGHEGTQRQNGGGGTSRGIRKDRAVMGAPFDRSPLTNAPVNELGIVLLFGMVAARLGFQVESVQGRFPDCEARREVAPGKWQRSRIEFEHESKNFLLHGHDPKKCDVIVCWRHNWKECPEEIEVIELCRILGRRQD